MATKIEKKLKTFIVKAYIGDSLEVQFEAQGYHKISVISFYVVMYGKTAYKIAVEEVNDE